MTAQQTSSSMFFCNEQLDQTEWTDVEKVSSLIQVEITEEAMAE